MTLRVEPARFPRLVVALLDVAYETDLDFDWTSFSALRPKDGMIDILGPGASEAYDAIRARLSAEGIYLMPEINILG